MRTQPTRETIDIETLLVRAYREKRIDRLPADPLRMLGIHGPARLGNNTLSRGERVDTSGFGANAAARINAMRSALTDAGELMLAAHDLVLSLEDYFVEDLRTADCKFTLWTKTGALDAGQWIEIVDHGATIQAATVTRSPGPEGEQITVKPIAGTRQRRLHRIVMAPLLVMTGRSGEVPYVSPIEVERMRKIYASDGRRVIEQVPVYVVSLDEVVRERGEYAAWHHALAALAAQLSEETGRVVCGPSLRAWPWDAEGVATAA